MSTTKGLNKFRHIVVMMLNQVRRVYLPQVAKMAITTRSQLLDPCMDLRRVQSGHALHLIRFMKKESNKTKVSNFWWLRFK